MLFSSSRITDRKSITIMQTFFNVLVNIIISVVCGVFQTILVRNGKTKIHKNTNSTHTHTYIYILHTL